MNSFWNKRRVGIAVAMATMASSIAHGEVVGEYEVGSGMYTSTAIFQFGNLNQHVFTIHYDGSPTGREAFDIIEQDLPELFNPEIKSYDFGDFLYGLGIGEDFDAGYGTPPDYFDYWHYWTRDSMNVPWDASMIGFSDRIFSDGSVDGWVFDSGDAPIPAPAGWVILLGTGIHRRRRS